MIIRVSVTLLLALALAACGASQTGPDIEIIATDVAGTLQAASTSTAAAASPTSEPEPSATTAPPTPIPSNTPESNRINFSTGATQGTVTGQVQANQTRSYMAGAAQNQIMIAQLFTPAGNAVLEVVGADGTVQLPASRGWNSFRSLLPKTQDYEFRVVGGNSTQDFTLSVTFAVPVRFASGASSATYDGRTADGNPVTYTVYAQANQDLYVTLNTNSSDAALTVWGFDTGTPYVRAQNGVTNYSLDLPQTQFYIIEVVPQAGRVVDYQIKIEVK